eukprot:3932207-Rhodomonas_salina.4
MPPHQVGVGGWIKKADLDTCCRVLRALGSEPAVFASPQFKELRMLLQPLNKMEEKRRYAGKSKSGDIISTVPAPGECGACNATPLVLTCALADIDKHKQQLRDK